MIWTQEEHENQGCWTFVEPRLRKMLNFNMEYVGRQVSGTPATGYPAMHRKQWDAILKKLFSI